jgi:hypothetical protein
MGKGRTQARLLRQAGKRIERHLEKVQVKPVSAFTVIGKAPRRKDALEKVTGKARHAADMALPGTLHAHVLRPPAHGATLKEIDTTAPEKIPGVRGNRSDNGRRTETPKHHISGSALIVSPV